MGSHSWMTPKLFKGLDPDVAWQVFEAIKSREGQLTKELVLEEARDPSSPLHPHFEWNDSKAAEAHRLSQARRMILNLRFEVRPGEVVRANIGVRYEAETRYVGYRELSDEERVDALMAQAQRDLRDWMRRYQELSDHVPGAFASLRSLLYAMEQEWKEKK